MLPGSSTEGLQTAERVGLSAGALVKTGNGWHAHFRPIPRLKPLGVVGGLTIRPVNRAYVILPPSLHPSGVRYRWVRPDHAPALADLPAMPEAALDLIAPALEPVMSLTPPRPMPSGEGRMTDGLRRYVDDVLAGVRSAEEGSRHSTATAAAVHLRKIERERGLPDGTFRGELEQAALDVGLDEIEVRGEGRRGIAAWVWEKVA